MAEQRPKNVPIFSLSLTGFCMFCYEEVCALECKPVFIDPVTSQAMFSVNCDGQENIEEGQLPLQPSPLANHRQPGFEAPLEPRRSKSGFHRFT